MRSSGRIWRRGREKRAWCCMVVRRRERDPEICLAAMTELRTNWVLVITSAKTLLGYKTKNVSEAKGRRREKGEKGRSMREGNKEKKNEGERKNGYKRGKTEEEETRKKKCGARIPLIKPMQEAEVKERTPDLEYTAW